MTPPPTTSNAKPRPRAKAKTPPAPLPTLRCTPVPRHEPFAAVRVYPCDPPPVLPDTETDRRLSADSALPDLVPTPAPEMASRDTAATDSPNSAGVGDAVLSSDPERLPGTSTVSVPRSDISFDAGPDTAAASDASSETDVGALPDATPGLAAAVPTNTATTTYTDAPAAAGTSTTTVTPARAANTGSPAAVSQPAGSSSDASSSASTSAQPTTGTVTPTASSSRPDRGTTTSTPGSIGSIALGSPDATGPSGSRRTTTPRRPGTDTPAPLGASDTSGILPEPRPWAASFIQAAMEVACGLRPSTQLIRWTTPEVHGMLVRRGSLTARALRTSNSPGVKPRLRALVLCAPKAGVYEVSAVIAEPQRIRAVAFRMEGLHGRWRVTELEMQGRAES